MCILKAHHANKLADMPDPRVEPEAWYTLIVQYPAEWTQLVKNYVDFQSVTAAGGDVMDESFLKFSTHQCRICE
eukprot:66759-Karenia_brevis.AAC.1